VKKKGQVFIRFWGQQPLVPLPLLGPPFFQIIIFLSTALSTRMTVISLHMQWPLTSQSPGSFLKENKRTRERSPGKKAPQERKKSFEFVDFLTGGQVCEKVAQNKAQPVF
jgi:hypothetical protein